MSEKLNEKLITDSINDIYIGTWFQRTRLHLSEVYDFIKTGSSPLNLDKIKLQAYQQRLNIKNVNLNLSAIDYIEILTENNITIKIYEDGLIILNTKCTSFMSDINKITVYYENILTKTLGYLFSLGIPLPKELADIKSVLPYFLILNKANKTLIDIIFRSLNEDEYAHIKTPFFEVYRGDKLYIINNFTEKPENIEKFVKEQIFMREFIAQMHRYLNIHRMIWEKIASIIEKQYIIGSDISYQKEKIDKYSKTIELINTRINQMPLFIATRENLVKSDKDLGRFIEILNYKYSTLSATHRYVAELWVITRSYVLEAKSIFKDLENQSTNVSLQNLTIVTTVGVGATLIGLFTRELPSFNFYGFLYFIILILIGYITNGIVKYYYKARKYYINLPQADRKIKF